MTIGLYAGSLHRHGSGIQIYIKDLLEHIVHIEPGINITLLYGVSRCPLGKSDYGAVARKVMTRSLILPERFAVKLWSKYYSPAVDIIGSRFDVFHSATSYLPPVRYGKKVVTVHDLVCLRYPEHLIISKESVNLMVRSIARADKVIADSKHTQQDITSLLGIPKEKVRVIYPGLDPVFLTEHRPAVSAVVLEKYKIPQPYILFVGNIDPRKNIHRLLVAYRDYLKGNPKGGRLVLVGKKTEQGLRDLHAIERFGLEKRVIYLGYVARSDMPVLYRHAKFFVYPSLYEGFGFPVLEAMACGAPVISSNTSSLPEIAGDAAYYVSPDSVDGIVHAMNEVGSDSQLRREMVRKGHERAALYRWDRTASEVIGCYRELVHGS